MALIKQQPYFPHYASSRSEFNIMKIRDKLGVVGYGIYYMLLERLRISEGYIEELDYNVIALDFKCKPEDVEYVMGYKNLFKVWEKDGTKYYESLELTSYMNFMEEKKNRRRQAAVTAANARWGKSNNSYSAPVAAEPIEDFVQTEETTSFPAAAQIDAAYEEQSAMKIDQEIQEMSKDTAWINYISKELNMTADAIVDCFEKFRLECIRNGRKSGHRDLQDAMSHFRSWMKKSGLAGPKTMTNEQSTYQTKAEQRELKRRQEIDRRHEERKQNYDRMEKEKMSTADYIKNKGYDPEKVSMVMMMKPGWMESNPPTHPEWIGKFAKNKTEEANVDVPF